MRFNSHMPREWGVTRCKCVVKRIDILRRPWAPTNLFIEKRFEMQIRNSKNDWDEVGQTNPVAKSVEQIRRQTRSVCAGFISGALIYGGPGIGKSHVIRGETESRKPLFLRPKDSNDIIEAFIAAGPSRPIILEEADNVFNTVPMINVMKIALDVNGPRESWDRKHGTVKLHAPVLVATNRDLRNMSLFPKEVRPHIEAICSRVAPICLAGSVEELWEYACYLAISQDMLRFRNGKAVSLVVQNTALEWFTRNMWRLDEVSPRRLKLVATMIEQYPDKRDFWEADLQPFLVRTVAEVAHQEAFEIPQIVPPRTLAA